MSVCGEWVTARFKRQSRQILDHALRQHPLPPRQIDDARIALSSLQRLPHEQVAARHQQGDHRQRKYIAHGQPHSRAVRRIGG
ncbi:hypothetical protein SDC9_184382 [bioreactor metagenome]|uniref:Uncharacterized protein n=1 Tax=bioreactor metagenome TaxID=1076179 RepID=A0A645HDR8_9ZZZZ